MQFFFDVLHGNAEQRRASFVHILRMEDANVVLGILNRQRMSCMQLGRAAECFHVGLDYPLPVLTSPKPSP